MSGSGINWRYRRDYFIRAGLCVCDPTNGDTCRHCDPAGRDGSTNAAIRAAVAEVAERERRRALGEARPAS